MRRADPIPSGEVTDPRLVLGRRELLRAAGLALAGVALPQVACGVETTRGPALPGVSPGPFSTDEERTRFEDATRYNNFYELGTDKQDPARNAARLRTRPWSVAMRTAAPASCGGVAASRLASFTRPSP